MENMNIKLNDLRESLLSGLYSDFRENTVVDHTQKILTRDAHKVINRLVVHCDDAPGWIPEHLSSFFVFERKFPICAYHYYVQEDVVNHMVGENVLTYHCAPFNSTSVAISLDYYPSRDEKLQIAIRPKLMDNLRLTATFLCLKYGVPPVKEPFRYTGLVGHRELPGTGFFKRGDNVVLRKICPGMAVDLDKLRYDVARLVQEQLNKLCNAGLTVDGIWGPKTRTAFSQVAITD